MPNECIYAAHQHTNNNVSETVVPFDESFNFKLFVQYQQFFLIRSNDKGTII